jgi:hypothetical protein
MNRLKWSVSDNQFIYDENGILIIESAEYYMGKELGQICKEHNYLVENNIIIE